MFALSFKKCPEIVSKIVPEKYGIGIVILALNLKLHFDYRFIMLPVVEFQCNLQINLGIDYF